MQDEVLAEELAQPMQQSRFMWMLSAMGFEVIFLLAAAAIAFAVVLLMILRGKGPAMVGAILLIVPLPLYVGLMGALKGIVASSSVIALSDASLKQSEIFMALAEMFLLIRVGAFLTIPAFLLATVGLIVRALQREPNSDPEPVVAKAAS